MEPTKNLFLRFLQYLYDVINRQGLIRRGVLGMTLYMTFTATEWAQHFADVSNRPGMEVAAIIAAATAPLMALQAAAFKHYLESRQENDK